MFYPRAFAILIVLAVDFTSTLPQNGVASVTDATAAATVDTRDTPQSCVTGKREAGTCVKRERCEHGTAVIDFSLYRPRGYKLSCPCREDVCCPPEYLVLVLQGVRVLPQNERFDFDDDD